MHSDEGSPEHPDDEQERTDWTATHRFSCDVRVVEVRRSGQDHDAGREALERRELIEQRR